MFRESRVVISFNIIGNCFSFNSFGAATLIKFSSVLFLKKDTFLGRNLGEAAAGYLTLIAPGNDVHFAEWKQK